MNILIDGHCIGDKSGGNETYWKNLIKYLNKVDLKNQYNVLLNKDFSYLLESSNFKKSYYNNKNTIWRNCISIPLNLYKNKFDLVHTQYYTPFFTKKRSVVTIHDISFERYPEYFKKSQLYINKLLIKKAAKTCQAIITISEFSKKDLIDKYCVDPNKIYVTYLAANNCFRVIDDIVAINKVKEKFNIKSKYILSVGNLQPRKNLGVLVEAFKRIKKANKIKEYKLVLVGKKVWKDKMIMNGLDINDILDDVIFTDYVSDEDLPYLYNGCEAFVYPSVFEGFGLPPLEAMKCGCVVIASNTSSIPEVVGDGGILFDPYDIDELSNKLTNVLNNNNLKLYYKSKALEQANKFSWEKTAKDTISVYEEIYNLI